MKISIAQIDVKVGDSEANLKKMAEYLKHASGEKADVIVFPEMSDTGYLMPIIIEKAAKWENGPVVTMQELALKHKIHVIVGLSERVEDDVYNTIASIDRDGNINAKYRKTHLVTVEPMFENKYLSKGNNLIVANVNNEQAGFLTCYEVRFPEVARCLTLGGAKIIFLPAAFPLSRIQHWKTLIAARSIENQIFVVAANRVGDDGPGLIFGGSSMVVDPTGKTIAEASKSEEKLLITDLDLSIVNKTRKTMSVLQDRRPELYSKIINPTQQTK